MSEQGETQSISSEPSSNFASSRSPNLVPQNVDSNQNPSAILSEEGNSRKRKLTSVVWKDFERVKINGVEFAICKICEIKLKAGSKNGTKSLHDHLARCKVKRQDMRQQVLKAGERRNDGQVELKNHYFDQEKSRYELSLMIILHEYPLSIVNHVGFRRFVSSLQPQFKIISRNTVKSDIVKIYDCEKAKTYKLLEKIGSRVAITTDMWTCNQTKKGFMAITAHFIDESWILQDRILSVTSGNVHFKSELDFYLEESVLPRTPNFDVLSWWKTNGVKFPTLQKIARDILAIPVSTVASESAFSTSGRLISPHRSRLHPNTLEALMCTQSWLWTETNGACATTMYAEEDDEE